MDWSSQTVPRASQQPTQVTVNISELDDTESIPERFVVIRKPDWSVSIGRGSMTEPGLSPSDENAWFTSRVMSRNHAILRANPVTKQLYIEDIGSMHGTQLDGTVIPKGVPQTVAQDSILTFGTQVVRGTDSYNPLRIQLMFDWSYEEPEKLRHSPYIPLQATSLEDDGKETNDIRASEEVEVVLESVRQPSVEIVNHSKTFRVPDDDSSSIISLDDDSVVDLPSSPSVPTDLSDIDRNSNHKNMGEDEIDSEYEEDIAFEPKQPVSQPDLFSDDDVDDDYNSDEGDYYENDCDDDDDDNEEDLDEEDGEKEKELSECLDSDPEDDMDDLLQPAQVNPKHGVAQPSNNISSFGYILRDPSPSDAAMAKPTTIKLSEVHPTTSTHNQSFAAVCDPAPAPIYNETAKVQDSSCDKSSSHVQKPVLGLSYNNFNVGNITSPIALPPLLFEPSGLPTLSSSSSVSKVGICTEGKDMQPIDQKLKRKADQISTSDPEHTSTTPVFQSEAGRAVPTPNAPEIPSKNEENLAKEPSLQTLHTSVNAANDEITSSNISTLPSIVVVDTDVNEPPRKKIKVGKGKYRQQQRGPSLVKYAATALAGIAVGAVGTVFGLAALPTDFFA